MEYRPLHKIISSDQKQSETNIEQQQGHHNKMKIKMNDVNDQAPVSMFMKTNVCRLRNIHEIHSNLKDETFCANDYKYDETTMCQTTENHHIQQRQSNVISKQPQVGNMMAVSQFYMPIPTSTSKIHCGPHYVSGDTSPASTTLSATSSDADHSDSASVDSLGDNLKYKLKIDRRKEEEREKSIIKSAHISNEYVRLKELLDAMSPEQILEEIKMKLDKRDSKAIVALSVLLPRKHFPPVDHLHCIRCHKKFRPSENGNCIMKHPTVKVIKLGQDKQGADFKCIACATTFRLNQM